MKEHETWECIYQNNDAEDYTERMKVPGGWLYRSCANLHSHSEDETIIQIVQSMCFVPA